MLNLLIADDNIDYARNLMHFINSTSDNIRVSDISINGKETLELLNTQNNIDIILLDLNMPFLTGIDIINNLSLQSQNKYKNSIIVVSGESIMMNKLKLSENDMIYKLLPKTLTVEQIISQINELILLKQNNLQICEIKSFIMNELLYLDYDISHKGTKYLIDAIDIIFIRGDSLIENLSKYVYPIIAKRYNQSVNNIKCNIIRATEIMYYNCSEKKFLDYFLVSTLHKPNIKTVINIILSKIHEKYI